MTFDPARTSGTVSIAGTIALTPIFVIGKRGLADDLKRILSRHGTDLNDASADYLRIFRTGFLNKDAIAKHIKLDRKHSDRKYSVE
jgi:hypothetical protein